MNFKVQRAGLQGDKWQTVCTNPNKDYAEEIYQKQLLMYSIGRFRLLDPNDKVIKEGKAAPLFSRN